MLLLTFSSKLVVYFKRQGCQKICTVCPIKAQEMERNAEIQAETTDPDNIPFTYKFKITLLVLNSLKAVAIQVYISKSQY